MFLEFRMSRFPVLRFFGICKSAGRGEEGLRRPRSPDCRSFSSPGKSSCQLRTEVDGVLAFWTQTLRYQGSVRHVHVDAVIRGTSLSKPPTMQPRRASAFSERELTILFKPM